MATPNLHEEQVERMQVMFEILIALFERAYLLVFEARMSQKQLRRWRTWEDYMPEWCRCDDFRRQLPQLAARVRPGFRQL